MSASIQGLKSIFVAALLAAWLAGFGPGSSARADEWRPDPDHPHRLISDGGYCNCVFSDRPILRGQEDEVDLETRFAKPDPVYARCYFIGPVGPLKADQFFGEIWIDGRRERMVVFENPPPPNLDQTQVWVTAEEYAEEMKALKPGRHEIIIWVMKKVPEEITMQDGGKKVIWKPVCLSKGEFVYVVP